ncbi:hypothetical protein L596_020477 [Steinernema carpocapsae]|uniref:F-box domain-containing protein n=1 Tax=Steinernema carpocapsae TaxID=34508 RepID=A0A4U5MTR0_STECR|nr:hypothetical protein L596_020477 [Steinernema carpocapsae]
MTVVGYLPPLPKSPAPPMAPIQTFDILELAFMKHRLIESGKRLRYERSPSSSPRGKIDENLFSLLPDEVLERIFSHCHLLDRVQLAHVCYRFHYLLTSINFITSDLSLLNISEKSVWSSKPINCTKSRLCPLEVTDRSLLTTVFKHCRLNENINVWYQSLNFVEDVYYSLNKHRVKFREISIYPHNKVIGLDVLHRYLPGIVSLSIHPHGEKFAQEKAHLEKLPLFSQLREISLQNVTVGYNFSLPVGLTKLGFRNGNFEHILPHISQLHYLRHLHIGHHEFSTPHFSELCQAISKTTLETLKVLDAVTVDRRVDGSEFLDFGFNLNIKKLIVKTGLFTLTSSLKASLNRFMTSACVTVAVHTTASSATRTKRANRRIILRIAKSKNWLRQKRTFKYCHFEGPLKLKTNWPGLREFRIEQCYGPLALIMQQIISFSRQSLKIVGISVQSNDSDLPLGDIFALSKRLDTEGITMDLTVFQKRQHHDTRN